MSLFEWNEALSVGHATIDGQHKRLFQLAGELHAAVEAGKGKQCLCKVLDNLVAYTRRHFADEEMLMQTHHYPEYPQHKAEHDALAHKVINFQKAFLADRATVSPELLQFLRDWLTHHIGVIDKKVGAYFGQQPS
jgi:hemerythrin-like metal-binding protein